MKTVLSSEEEQFTLSLVEAIAPNEIELARDILQPQGRWSRFTSSRGPVGYGVEAVIDVVAPYAVIVGAWALGVVQGEAKEVIEGKLKELTRRGLGRLVKAPEVSPPSYPPDMDELERQATHLAVGLGMDPAQAEVLAAAIRGRVAKGNN